MEIYISKAAVVGCSLNLFVAFVGKISICITSFRWLELATGSVWPKTSCSVADESLVVGVKQLRSDSRPSFSVITESIYELLYQKWTSNIVWSMLCWLGLGAAPADKYRIRPSPGQRIDKNIWLAGWQPATGNPSIATILLILLSAKK